LVTAACQALGMNFSIEFRFHPDPKEGAGSLRDLRVVTMVGEAVVPNFVEVLPQISPEWCDVGASSVFKFPRDLTLLLYFTK
jgi:hypothetical protein